MPDVSRPQPWAEPSTNQAMFSRVAKRYDRLNTLMSLGRDQAWRRDLVERAAPPGAGRALDIGTGTGDLALALAARASSVVAADLTPAMLAYAAQKFAGRRGGPPIDPALSDALHLPYADESFDVVVSGFVLRNLHDLAAAFREWHRVLRPGGRVGAVEMTHPPGRIRNSIQQGQLRFVAPVMARIVGAEPADYRYISKSLERFPTAPDLAHLMEATGFVDASYEYRMLGAVAIHVATKRA